MKRILMVCLGNICRSPIAEGIMQQKIDERGLNAYVDSAGTANYHVGQSPDPRSIESGLAHNIDIRHLRGRQFSRVDYDKFDLIYTMDSSNYFDVLHLAQSKEDEEKVDMILNNSNPGSNQSVPDPYYGGDQGFENVFQMLDKACDVIADRLENE